MENEKSPKQKKLFIILGILFLFITVIGVTYSFVNLTVQGTKRQVIKAGTLSLELYEDNEIIIGDALPMYDEVGMIQEKAFTFRLVNNSAIDSTYTIKLVEVGTGTLSKSDVKYGFTKEGTNTIGLISDLQNGVIDSGTIAGNQTTINYALRFWIKSDVEDETLISGKSLTYKIDIEVGMEEVQAPSDNKTVTFAGITKEVNETPEAMFNYTSEGVDPLGEESVEATNGIYSMLDDDGMSYFYRGEVDNLVQFGEYEQDYYVYRDNNYDYDFVSLEACQYAGGTTETCVKTKKYDAGTPMYWKIIRINGDGTIRMIYAGTTTDAVWQETGIGVSRYNEEWYGETKYTGYTYDRTTSEIRSNAKIEIDNWYQNNLANTEYDTYVADGKFCSNSSGYAEVSSLDVTVNAFGSYINGLANTYYGLGNASPSFKCPETSETFGGSYILKAGLITFDEIIAAGGQATGNTSYYLYTGTKENYDGWFYWSMSPARFRSSAFVGIVYDYGDANSDYVYRNNGLLRPVINLRANVVFKQGTDGSILTPYEIVME